jgi:hypothetical protein
MTKPKPETSQSRLPKTPRGQRGGKPHAGELNQATTDEFEREDMGIAPKE